MKSITKPIIIFSISGIIAVGGVYAYAHNRMHNSEHRAEWIVATVSDKLELDDTQVAKLNVVKDELIAVRNKMQNEHDATHIEVLSMLDQAKLDRQQVLNLIDNKTHLVQQKAPSVVNAFAEFYDSLSEAQHQILRDHINSMMEHRGHHDGNHFWNDGDK